jgi:hypothetical protein|tara:strand:- start:556 stop:723 length:168 start_codon:yes stop_codon:yes gene_type:complete
MTDQTKWGIDQVQQENKARAREQQRKMRDEIAFFVLNCSVFKLQKMYEEMKRLKK